MTLTWPTDHTGWRLQSQTNSLNVGINTNWVEVPGEPDPNAPQDQAPGIVDVKSASQEVSLAGTPYNEW